MFRFAIFILLACESAGCRTHLALRDRTLQTAATLADLHYQHVLDNVARFERQPATLPSIAVVNNGNVIVSDQGNVGAAGTYAPTITQLDQIGGFPIFSLFVNPNVTRNLSENWSMVPVTDINKIRRLRCAFQLLVANPCTDVEYCMDKLDGFLPSSPDQIANAIPRGWYCVGNKKQVPKETSCTAHFEGTYVWVMPWGIDGMSKFTLTILQLATSEIDDSNTKKIVKSYNADGQLLGTEITTEEPDEDADDAPSLIESGAHMDSVNIPIRHKLLKGGGSNPKQAARTPKQARKRIGF